MPKWFYSHVKTCSIRKAEICVCIPWSSNNGNYLSFSPKSLLLILRIKNERKQCIEMCLNKFSQLQFTWSSILPFVSYMYPNDVLQYQVFPFSFFYFIWYYYSSIVEKDLLRNLAYPERRDEPCLMLYKKRAVFRVWVKFIFSHCIYGDLFYFAMETGPFACKSFRLQANSIFRMARRGHPSRHN